MANRLFTVSAIEHWGIISERLSKTVFHLDTSVCVAVYSGKTTGIFNHRVQLLVASGWLSGSDVVIIDVISWL